VHLLPGVDAVVQLGHGAEKVVELLRLC